RRVQSHWPATQSFRLDDWRHPRNAGDARLLRRPQHHRRRRGYPHSESQRSLRETAQVGCEVPLLNRYGFSQIRVTKGRELRFEGQSNHVTEAKLSKTLLPLFSSVAV